MSRQSRHNLRRVAAVIVAAGALAGLSACRGLPSRQPPVHLNPNMDNQDYIQAQEPSSFWPDGRGMRPQVEGTVAVGELFEDDHTYRGRVDGEYAGAMPPEFPLEADLLHRGRERYDIFCAPCHARAGTGDGIVLRRATNWAADANLHTERRRGFPVGQLFEVITNGVNTMPGYADQIPVRDRWAIAAWVRALQLSQGVTADAVPAGVAAEQGWSRQ